ncbi:MAG: flippase-like domain-containing protein [Deltaproteobacteria bacterium]|nr:flippase-like domain-containing protein [Deltaproteobacteria bacterium]
MKSAKKIVGFGVKLLVSFGLVAFVLYKIGQQAEWDQLKDRLAAIDPGWTTLAVLAQLAAMACTLGRWKLLLDGQQMVVPWKHLLGAFMIGRFIGTFTPSTIGLDGYRMYDIAKHSGKVAPAVSVILVEKVIGFFVLSVLVLATLPWGFDILPTSTLSAVAVLYLIPVTLSLVLLVKPSLIQRLLGVFFRPGTKLGKKVETAAAAVTTYEAQRGKLLRAVALGFPVHIFSIFIFIFTGYAIGAPVSVTEMLFVGPLVITATVLPISLSGLGVREAAFIYLLTKAGVTTTEAALLSFLGYVIGRAISMAGGVVWLARRIGYKVEITGKAMEGRADEGAGGRADERTSGRTDEEEPERALLGAVKHVWTGATAGLLAGMVVGVLEMTYILLRIPPPRPWGSLLYAGGLYGVFLMVAGAGTGLGLWLLARFFSEKRRWLRATAEGLWAGLTMAMISGLALVIVRFRVFRDWFDERLPPMSAGGLGLQLLMLVVFGALFVGGYLGLRKALRAKRAAWFRRTWGPLVPIAAMLLPGLLGMALASERGVGGNRNAPRPPAGSPNVVLIMIDTMRVDEVGAYNPEAAKRKQTPNIDQLAKESIVFRQAFANASWTKPSVASILTGRFPSAHGAVSKDDALPDGARTIAELLSAKGYRTAGVVTNYNLAPDFNFQQGFDEYRYLTPRYFLGADDTTAKLALYQIFRLFHERYFTGAHDVERYYQDAKRTTDEGLAWLDRHRAAEPDRPFFLWVQYMDPHDPYFAHDGTGEVYGHAINPDPPKEKRDRILDVYRQEIRFTDEHVGRLLDGLRERGLLDDSVVVLWSDHGEEFQDHGDWWHGTSLYDELVHVPLMVRPPRTTPRVGWDRPPMRLSHLDVPFWVSLVDVPYTVLSEAGYTAQELAGFGQQGADLIAPRTQALVFMEEDHQGNVLRALRWTDASGQPFKLIEAEAIARPGLRPEELYSVAGTDRAAPLTAEATAAREHEDLTAQRPEVLADGRQRIAVPAEAARLAALPRQVVTTATDTARLEALGYIQKAADADAGTDADGDTSGADADAETTGERK